ncbi:MAG: hypothetical protein R3F54_28670 [Alphaproteobacteria bacterium]
MTLPIGIVGAGGAGAAKFVIPRLFSYSGATILPPVVSTPTGQQVLAGLTTYSGVTINAPSVRIAVAAGIVTYSGVTIHAPQVTGSDDVAAGLTTYSGATIHAPTVAGAQNINAGLTTYSGATINAPTVGGGQNITAGLTTYSGVTINSPTVLGSSVRLLDAWTTFTPTTSTATGTKAISAGTNRMAFFHIAYEGGTNLGTPTYGGQALTLIGKFDDDANSGLFYLNEAGLQAATSSAFDFDCGSVTAAVISIGSYERVNQGSPIFDSDLIRNLTGNSAAFDLDTVANGVAIAAALSGNASVFAWTSPMSEQTDQSVSTVTGSVAHVLPSTTTTVSVETTGSGITPNRTTVIAAAVRPNAVATLLDAGLATYSGATVHAPTVSTTAADVEALDAWTAFTGVGSGTYAVSSGSNRLLVMAISLEGSETVGTPNYGGSDFTLQSSEPVGGNINQIWTLDEAGIAAAGSTTWDADLSGSSSAEIIALGSYENVNQTTPIFDEATSVNASGNAADFDLDTVAGGAAIAHAVSGNASVFAWDASLTEQTDATNGTATGSVADVTGTATETISVGATGSSITPNRASITAISLNPA